MNETGRRPFWLVFLAAGCALGAANGAAAALPKDCQDADLAMMVQGRETAGSYFKACYSDPSADADAIVYARYQRAQILQAANLHSEALAEYEALLAPELAASPNFDRRLDAAQRRGATRAVVAVIAARLALGLGDPQKGLAYAELALREAAKQHRVHTDVSGEAYMLRARIKAGSADPSADIVRAYVRGNQDPWILEAIKAAPPPDLAKINALRDRLVGAYAEYISLYMLSVYMINDPRLPKAAAAGDAVYEEVIREEAAFLGPDVTTTGN